MTIQNNLKNSNYVQNVNNNFFCKTVKKSKYIYSELLLLGIDSHGNLKFVLKNRYKYSVLLLLGIDPLENLKFVILDHL